MGIFEDVTLTWGGKDYKVESDKVMLLIAKIESVITLADLSNNPSMTKVAFGYGAALRFAGAEVSDEEIYDEFFNKEDAQVSGADAIFGLLSIMIPPKHLRGDSSKPGKAKPGKKKAQ